MSLNQQANTLPHHCKIINRQTLHHIAVKKINRQTLHNIAVEESIPANTPPHRLKSQLKSQSSRSVLYTLTL